MAVVTSTGLAVSVTESAGHIWAVLAEPVWYGPGRCSCSNVPVCTTSLIRWFTNHVGFWVIPCDRAISWEEKA